MYKAQIEGGFRQSGSSIPQVLTDPQLTDELQDQSAGVLYKQSGGSGGTGGTSDCCNGGQGGHGGGGGGGGGNAAVATSSGNYLGSWRITTTGATQSPAVSITTVSGKGGTGGIGFDNGGTGGNGGAGAIVSANTTHGPIIASTLGAASPAMSLQGIGGDGGAGGHGDIEHGGRGGNGGNGSSIGVNEDPAASLNGVAVQTQGNQSPAMILVSQGGKGGNGGVGEIFGKGGNGGGGGGGGAIQVGGLLTINTGGTQSPGLAAYSLGGTGGQGGDGGFFNPTSGSGGSTGVSGNVTINIGASSTITTTGPASSALIAQSVAGHAGSGGLGLNPVVEFGAAGGSAGAGGVVSVTNAAVITTYADQSSAIVAQSHGGGGGAGGSGFATFYASGGSGSVGGDGGAVTVANSGKLSQAGNDAHGIFAQSIGGTGGAGGTSVAILSLGGGAVNTSNGGPVSVSNSGVIVTGDKALAGGSPKGGPDPVCGTGCSLGIYAQSIGGGGGHGGSSYGWFSIGGQGGGGGRGGTVTVGNSNSIHTFLDSSQAIFAQSIGGGGSGGSSVAVGAITQLAIGGNGAKIGDGGDVSVATTRGAGLVTEGDTSPAVAAQSVGGGGGNGGFAVGVSASSTVIGGGVSIGGTGGAGGSGGVVSVNTIDPSYTGSQPNTIQTAGKGSHGIFAHSVGGGGGNGNFAIDATASVGFASFAAAVGGSGGVAGDGAAVTVTSNAHTSTTGDGAYGTLAQSVGGGGGNGGFAIAGTVDIGVGKSVGVSVALGGKGNAGGAASTVIVRNSGVVTTTGANSHGLVAQSTGGGGGNGNLSIAGTISGSSAATLGVSLGGQGGKGGSAGVVQVVNSSSVTTLGDKAMGVLAQSLGGGGGNGGMSFAASLSGPETKNLNISLGGAGGNSGNGGGVSVTNTGAITTGNSLDPGDAEKPIDNAHGIFAQSVGGGGGIGGFAGALTLGVQGSVNQTNLSIAVGGSGGSSGAGGPVTIDNSNAGAITSYSNQSSGIYAQSVGGSGGTGGSGFAATAEFFATTQSNTLNVSVAVGGHGGSGNVGGTVNVSNAATVNTYGAASHGLFASSVGGSGGSGGSIRTLAYNAFCPESDPATGLCGNVGPQSWNLQVAVGGKGGSGNHGGSAGVINSGPIHTRGDGATAIYAYSIGGGGGDGGDASGLPTIPGTSRVKTFKSWSAFVGGSQGSSGNGGAVHVTNQGQPLITEGLNSPGVYAQSVGGGGGRGGTGASGAGLTSLAIGGAGGAAGDGGKVTVDFTGGSISTGKPGQSASDPNTDLDGSYGIFAQSVGGGGGQAGNAQLFVVSREVDQVKLDVGLGATWLQAGGNAGNGGVVSVNTSANITTRGASAIGIFAQSVGGGGGVAGRYGFSEFAVLSALYGSAGGNGLGGPVSVDYTGVLTTHGSGATGIFAQSGGGKVALSTNGPAGSDVNVTVNGTVAAHGSDASGIFVQSARAAADGTNAVGAGDSHVTVKAGSTVQGGLAGGQFAGAGVQFYDGVANTLDNAGTITSVAGIAGVAVANQASSSSGGIPGNLKITNTGTLIGSVLSASTLNNGATGMVQAGPRIDLGADGVFNNSGTLAPAGEGQVGSTRLTGTLQQGPTGKLAVDVQAGRAGTADHADLLRINGNAELAGRVQVNLTGVDRPIVGAQSVPIVIVDGVLSGAERLSAVPSAVAQYRLSQPQANTLSLGYEIHFANPTILASANDNVDGLARGVQALYLAGALSEKETRELIAVQDAGAYSRLLNGLGGEINVDNQMVSLYSSLQFGDTLLSCPLRSGDYRFINSGQCSWYRLQVQRFKLDESSDNLGFSEDGWQLAGGGQMQLDSDWNLGSGLSVKNGELKLQNASTSSSGYQVQLGVSAKRRFDATELSGSVAVGYGDFSIERSAPGGARARGHQNLWLASGQLRLTHLIDRGSWYLMPRIDLGVDTLWMEQYSESGAHGLSLNVKGQNNTYFNLQPAIEMGMEFETADYLIRPKVVAGVTQFLGNTAVSATGSFAQLGAGTSFTTSTRIDRTRFDLALAVDIFSGKSVVLHAGMFGSFSGNSNSYGGAFKLSLSF